MVFSNNSFFIIDAFLPDTIPRLERATNKINSIEISIFAEAPPKKTLKIKSETIEKISINTIYFSLESKTELLSSK